MFKVVNILLYVFYHNFLKKTVHYLNFLFVKISFSL